MPAQLQNENQAFEGVVRRLAERFPAVPEPVISTVVQAERRRLNDRPVREFLPLLAERAACARLREAHEV